MKIGAVIIGDEILNGKRQDHHFSFCQSFLAERGLEINWAVMVGDAADELSRFLSFTMGSDALVFCFGGIGATPDDRTRQTVASVQQVPLVPHPDAVAEIEAQYAEKAYPNRILMAQLPQGSNIIPNPVNRVPGFSFGHHHFMPGFPEMAWPMMAWVMDHHYPLLKDLKPQATKVIYIYQGRESDLLATMQQIVRQFPALRLSSLPCLHETLHIELTLSGIEAEVEQAMRMMIEAVETAGFNWEFSADP